MCHLPTVHTGGFHVGLGWSSTGLERRTEPSVCGQPRARDILLILQHTKSKNGANLTGTSTASHHSFLQRLKHSLCSIWFHATGDSFTLCQTNVFFFFPFTVSFHPWAPHHNGSSISVGRFLPRDSSWKRQRQNKEDVLESRVSYQPPTSGQD